MHVHAVFSQGYLNEQNTKNLWLVVHSSDKKVFIRKKFDDKIFSVKYEHLQMFRKLCIINVNFLKKFIRGSQFLVFVNLRHNVKKILFKITSDLSIIRIIIIDVEFSQKID